LLSVRPSVRPSIPTLVLNQVSGQTFRLTGNNKQQQSFYGPLSRTTRVSQYQKKHSPTHQSDHHPIIVIFFHLLRSIASCLFKVRVWQSFCTTSLHVLFGLPLDLEPSTSYSIHFFTQLVFSVGSKRSVCLFVCLFVQSFSQPSLMRFRSN